MFRFIYFSICLYLCLLTITITGSLATETFPSDAMYCDIGQSFKPISVENIPCDPPIYRREEVKEVVLFNFVTDPYFPGICLCKGNKRIQHCEKNFLWANTAWERLEPNPVSKFDCVKHCSKAFSESVSLSPSTPHPLNCPWMSSGVNTSVELSATLYRAVYYPTRNLLEARGDRDIKCRPQHGMCSLSPDEMVVMNPKLISKDCEVRSSRSMSTVREDGGHSSTIKIRAEEETLHFTNPCLTKVCGIEGVLSEEGFMVSKDSFSTKLPTCKNKNFSTVQDHSLAHAEFLSDRAIKEINQQRKEICRLGSLTLDLYLKSKIPVPSSLLSAIDHASSVHNVYIVKNHVLYSKPCMKVTVYNYTRKCPGVWEAQTNVGLKYASQNFDELLKGKPPCLNKEMLTTLPGGYVVTINDGKYEAIPGSSIHHKYIRDYTNSNLDLLTSPHDFSPNHFVEEDTQKDPVTSYKDNFPNVWSWLMAHPFTLGFTALISSSICLFVGVKVFLIVVRSCSRRRILRRVATPETIPMRPIHSAGDSSSSHPMDSYIM